MLESSGGVLLRAAGSLHHAVERNECRDYELAHLVLLPSFATERGNGRNDGHLQAYDAAKGKLLWSFQTGAGANNTATIFSLDGQEVVAFYAAGSALAGSAHGDELWLFGLGGKLGPRARSAAA
jgi:outer membrane protein assembly factor BamB